MIANFKLGDLSARRIRDLSLVWRAILWLTLTIGLACILSQFIVSRSEVFWVLVAPVAWSGSFGFRLFPTPKLNAKTRIGYFGTIAILIAFPAAFYSFLVFATSSPWSWTELAIAILFFAIALETVLIYLMQIHETLTIALIVRCGARWTIPILIVTRGVLYSALIPLLLVILAVHRPKLLPRTLHEIPAQAREQVEFLSRDHVTHLRGVFLKPAFPKGTVLVCHGVGANHSDIASIITILYDCGYQVLAFDFRGHGASDGHTITYGWAERNDVLAAYDFCLQRPDVQPDQLYALGVSMGGATLIEALPEMAKIRAAVIDSAFASLGDMAEHQFRFIPSACRPSLRQVVRVLAWIEVGVDIETIRPVDRIAEISIPLLLIHGASDQIIPVDQGRKLAAAGRAENVQLHIEPDSPHIGMAVLNPNTYTRLVRHHFGPEIQTARESGRN
ncbi:MAG: hypothetical protein JWM11_2167 [Planctomycetaceae bacterium]|nr:hypothetical protein [Planctomycetaceae bacterium]